MWVWRVWCFASRFVSSISSLPRALAPRLFTEWKTSQSREDIDNELTDTTEQVTYNNMKPNLIIQILLVLLRISNDFNFKKYFKSI